MVKQRDFHAPNSFSYNDFGNRNKLDAAGSDN